MSYWQIFRKKKIEFPWWLVGTGIGAAFLMVGFFYGQLEEIYQKAIMICLECIGIG
ncbi:MAG: hypothetical protein J6A75_11265 [Lachnospiraceae bacterium]|nr:hypothetical protein [Lachnospiraceae bacterium]